ncbi:MAG: biopolymer transporter ExbD [Muribaculaceae bacterium]|nr:biopolymer transporter ExbD [Muribaculaceae bacterium]
MALKRQFDMSATFSMASMTDVIFLLLIFFMVTSTFVFPNALEVNLPESSTQTTLKPTARIYLDTEGRTATMYGEGADWQLLDSINHESQLQTFFTILHQQETEENPTSFVALYADREVPYGRVVEMLNLGAENNVRVVLATSAPSSSTSPKANGK